jgi:hypothetical protein
MSDQDTASTDSQDDVNPDPVDDAQDGKDTDGADQLGDAGKKALDAMKVKWQKERDARKVLADRLAALEKPGDKDQPDPEAIRKAAREEARAEALKDRVLDKIEAKAAKLFADPEDAVALLGRRADEFIDDGSVDLDAIQQALDDLLKKKPHLGAQGGKRFQGSADSGPRNGGAGKAPQLTEQDLKRMSPEQIVAAREKGQLNTLLGAT